MYKEGSKEQRPQQHDFTFAFGVKCGVGESAHVIIVGWRQVCAVLARIVQAVTSDLPRFQDSVRRHRKVAEQIFAGFDSLDFRGDDSAKPPNWNSAPSAWCWKKIPIPPS